MSEAQKSADAGHELSDLEPRLMALFGALLAAAIVVAAAVTFLFLKYASVRQVAREAPAPPPAGARDRVPAPRLQVQGSNELREMRAAEDRVLNSYVWIDREKGLVRIPVERAMELLAEKKGMRREAAGTSQKNNSKK